MNFLKFVGKFTGTVLVNIIGIVVVVYAWFYHPQTLVEVFDWNLRAIKWLSSFLSPQDAARVESALRGGLMADRAMILLEGVVVVQTALQAVRYTTLGLVRALRRP